MNFNLFDDLDDRVVYNRNMNISGNMADIPEMYENMMNADNNDDNVMTEFPSQTPLAMAYVPFQQWGKTYDVHEGFEKGTIFPDLDFPFMRGGGQGE